MNILVQRKLFIQAVRIKDFYEVSKTLSSGFDPNFVDEGTTPIEVAANSHSLRMVSLLLEQGADPNFCNVNRPDFALHKAVCSYVCVHPIEIINLLLEANADVNRLDYNSNTVLYLALYRFRIEVAKLLLERGADPNAIFKDEHIIERFGSGLSTLVEIIEPYQDQLTLENMAKYKSLRLKAIYS